MSEVKDSCKGLGIGLEAEKVFKTLSKIEGWWWDDSGWRHFRRKRSWLNWNERLAEGYGDYFVKGVLATDRGTAELLAETANPPTGG